MLGNANRRQSFLYGISATYALSILCVAAFGQCELHEVQKLLAFDGSYYDMFGYSVSVSGNIALVGVPRDDDHGDNSGSVFAYRNDGTVWVLEAKLLASDGAAGDFFGTSIALNGDIAVIGSPGHGDNGSSSGSVYVFERDRLGVWKEMVELLASDGAADDNFGQAVSLSGNVALVGASGDADQGHHTGSAYIFARSRAEPDHWAQAAKLTASEGAQQDLFGLLLCINGDVAVIGAAADDDNGGSSGSAYVFVRPKDGWADMTENTKLTAFDGAQGDNFGLDVSVSGDLVAVGAARDNDHGENSGSLYLFERNEGGPENWGFVTKLTPQDGAKEDLFGFSVTLIGNRLMVGAPTDDAWSGSAYLFARDEGGGDNWGLVAKLTASDGARSNSFFGFSTSMTRDVAVVGAIGDDDNGLESGSAYIVELSCPDPCPWDLDKSGAVGSPDLLSLLVQWGTDPGGPPDFDGDGDVGVKDLLFLLGAWGPCP